MHSRFPLVLLCLVGCVDDVDGLDPSGDGPRGGCAPRFEPGQLNLGRVIGPTRRAVQLLNDGEGGCTLDRVDGSGAVAEWVELPLSPGTMVSPGSAVSIPITVWPGGPEAVFRARFVEGPSAELRVLGAEAAGPTVMVIPERLALGAAMTEDCRLRSQTVTVLNPNRFGIEVLAAWEDGGGFASTPIRPRGPRRVPSGGQVVFELELRPRALGPVEGWLQITWFAPGGPARGARRVLITADVRPEVVEHRYRVEPAALDAVFVVEDASANREAQARFLDHLQPALERLRAWDSTRIGVLAARGGVALGRLVSLSGGGSPFTSAEDTDFPIPTLGAVSVGSQVRAGLSKGIDAAYLGLSAELADANGRFRRPGAALAVVVVAERPDRSETDPAEARASFDRLADDVRVIRATAEPEGGPCRGPAGEAEAEDGYQGLGGAWVDLCGDTWGAELSAALGAPLRGPFPVPGADAGTLEVTVGDRPLTEGADPGFVHEPSASRLWLVGRHPKGTDLIIRYPRACQ